MTDNMLARVGRVDFFAVFPSGFYLFIVIILLFMSFANPEPFIEQGNGSPKIVEPAEVIQHYLSVAIDAVTDKIGWLLFVLFSVYLLGSIVRSIPLRLAEGLINLEEREKFPYRTMLLRVVDELKNTESVHLDDEKLPIIDNGFSITVFNHWKDVICMEHSQSFEFYRSFESRSRLFVGMFWAGLIGVLISVAVKFNCGIIPAGQLFICSFFVMAFFGYKLKKVREQEAKVLLSLYIHHLQKEKCKSEEHNGAQGKELSD